MPKCKVQPLASPRVASSPVPRLSLSIPEVAASTSLSKSTLYNCMKDGSLKFIKAGSRRLITMVELEAFLGRLAEQQGAA